MAVFGLKNKIMVIIKLQGGLGNQMFQYALGRSLAEKNKIDFKLDLSFYNKEKNNLHRNYSLKYFNIIENIAEEDELKKTKEYRQKNKLIYFFYRIFSKKNIVYVKENFFYFGKDILKIKNNAYLDGYWQSEKYFKNIESIIKQEFTLKNKLDSRLENLVEDIKNTNSVSIHIRRGDYITNQKTNSVHGTCSLDYYQTAIEHINNKIKNPIFFIFSDDIEWVKNNLKTEFPTFFIEGNKDYEDLILMSYCKHNIIANSSFSWWGAWLDHNPNKIVIAPKKWFNVNNINTSDLLPNSWINL